MNGQPKSTGKVSNKPLPWPYGSKEARDRSAEEAVFIVRMLDEIIENTNDPLVLKLTARALRSATIIIRFMEREGSPTRPQ